MCKTRTPYTPMLLSPSHEEEGKRELRLSGDAFQGSARSVDLAVWCTSWVESCRLSMCEASQRIAEFTEDLRSLAHVQADEVQPATWSSLGAAYSM
mmetsp:Transcript_59633/g.154867  ORF Transcript_59633/g.154867 Transcript_59633/m.154867 type:complete len:96 (-) Transcript_59633:115-402(-)